MSAAETVAKTLLRVVTILPELLDLWEAVERPDPHAIALKQARLIRAMKDAQMREELRRG